MLIHPYPALPEFSALAVGSPMRLQPVTVAGAHPVCAQEQKRLQCLIHPCHAWHIGEFYFNGTTRKPSGSATLARWTIRPCRWARTNCKSGKRTCKRASYWVSLNRAGLKTCSPERVPSAVRERPPAPYPTCGYRTKQVYLTRERRMQCITWCTSIRIL